MYQGNGQVAVVTEKPFRDKWGKDILLYSFKLHGDESWYRTGTNRPSCAQGDAIQFTFEQVGNNKKVDPRSIEVTQQGAPNAQPTANQPTVQSNSPRTNSRDAYWENKEKHDKEVTQPRISYAAAQKNATAIVTAALAHDILGFGNAKKADKLEMLLGYVDEVTNHLAVRLDAGHEILTSLKEANGQIEPNVVDEDAMYAEHA